MKKKLKVKVKNEVGVEERLTNTKPWFNGVHTFSSVKINNAPVKEEENVLKVNVADGVGAKGGLV